MEVIAQGLTPPSIAAGYQIGAYTIVSQLGVGGMGEVYRARDTKLGRDVAIKILPPLFTADPQRLARFEREARTLASLNHPHIGSIYGLEYVEGTPALVLELVEGDTLAERIAAGPVPLADALAIAAQIADALEAAHDKGIVHRDLKHAGVAQWRDVPRARGALRNHYASHSRARLARYFAGWEDAGVRRHV
jgi:serine/threonine protein kinase